MDSHFWSDLLIECQKVFCPEKYCYPLSAHVVQLLVSRTKILIDRHFRILLKDWLFQTRYGADVISYCLVRSILFSPWKTSESQKCNLPSIFRFPEGICDRFQLHKIFQPLSATWLVLEAHLWARFYILFVGPFRSNPLGEQPKWTLRRFPGVGGLTNCGRGSFRQFVTTYGRGKFSRSRASMFSWLI